MASAGSSFASIQYYVVGNSRADAKQLHFDFIILLNCKSRGLWLSREKFLCMFVLWPLGGVFSKRVCLGTGVLNLFRGLGFVWGSGALCISMLKKPTSV